MRWSKAVVVQGGAQKTFEVPQTQKVTRVEYVDKDVEGPVEGKVQRTVELSQIQTI